MRVELSPKAERQLRKLPVALQQEVLYTHLPKIQAAPYTAGKKLKGKFRGQRSYHFGRRPEYRIIYEVSEDLNHYRFHHQARASLSLRGVCHALP